MLKPEQTDVSLILSLFWQQSEEEWENPERQQRNRRVSGKHLEDADESNPALTGNSAWCCADVWKSNGAEKKGFSWTLKCHPVKELQQWTWGYVVKSLKVWWPPYYFGTLLSCMLHRKERWVLWRDHVDGGGKKKRTLLNEFLALLQEMACYRLQSLLQLMNLNGSGLCPNKIQKRKQNIFMNNFRS